MSTALLLAAQELPPAQRVLASGPDLTRYLLVCGGLIALVLVCGWAARRFVGGSLRTRASQRSLQVVDVLPLGAKHRVGVLRCGERSFLLGFGEGGVRLLTELEATEPAAERFSAEQRRIFAAALQRASGRSAAPEPPAARPQPREAAPAPAARVDAGVLA